MTAFAAPALAAAGRLHFAFDEDETTLAWDAAHAAGLKPGNAIQVEGVDLPAWWWDGTGLRNDPQAGLVLRIAQTALGPVAFVDDGRPVQPEALAQAALALATAIDPARLAQVEAARQGADSEADFPLGAYVHPARHDEVLAQRLRLPAGKVLSWTTIGAGAAPTEFMRLQAAVGAYHVVLVDCAGERTVGIWAGDSPPRIGQDARPVLRRLFRTQGAWRHGVKFG
jgi:hypothetical protein